MDIPLDVIEDEQGRLRDIHDRPMVLIFSSKPRRPRRPRPPKDKGIGVTHKKFEFINIVKPGDVSEASRHLIKTHVMQNVRHRQRENSKATQSAPSGGQLCSRNHVSHSPSTIPPQITTDGPAFIGFPVPMQPYMRKLLHQCESPYLENQQDIPHSKPSVNPRLNIDNAHNRPKTPIQSNRVSLVPDVHDRRGSLPRRTVHVSYLDQSPLRWKRRGPTGKAHA